VGTTEETLKYPAVSLARAVACAGIALMALGTASSSAAAPAKPATQPVYFEGRKIDFTPAPRHRGEAEFVFGPWIVGPRLVHEKPRDKRPNMYMVVPGSEYTFPGELAYDHNEIVSTIPTSEDSVDFDVYWALVLDPGLTSEFRSERELVLATQEEFTPGPGFTFEEVPSAKVLHEYLGVDSLEDLEQFRRPNGELPRVVIVPAGFSVPGKVIDPEAPPPEHRSWRDIFHRDRVPSSAARSH
jgi:hypothetical protein